MVESCLLLVAVLETWSGSVRNLRSLKYTNLIILNNYSYGLLLSSVFLFICDFFNFFKLKSVFSRTNQYKGSRVKFLAQGNKGSL